VLERAPDVLWRAMPGCLLLAKADGAVTEIHGPVPEVWELLAEPVDEDHLIDLLAERFAAARATVEAELRSLLHELVLRGLVCVVPAPPGERP
jgi:Coenzyme PQQ synthesis protein D (PqqD)